MAEAEFDFDGYEGAGIDAFTQDTVGEAYLGMVQPSSEKASTIDPGQWINTGTNEPLGPVVDVVPLVFTVAWIERDSKAPYYTVGRYEPGSINVDIVRPKPGTRGFPKMTNPLTGNKVEELFVYLCLVGKDLLYFSPTALSMQTCKHWNSMLRSQRLSSGKIAPIFAYHWLLETALVPNPNRPTEKTAKFVSVARGEKVNEVFFKSTVAPAVKAGRDLLLLAGPDTDEE